MTALKHPIRHDPMPPDGASIGSPHIGAQHLRAQPDVPDPSWHERNGQRYRLVDHGNGRVSAGIKHPGEDGYGQVGYLSHFDDGEIKNTWVHPAHRRNGVATALLAYARQQHPDLGIHHSTNLTEDAKAWMAHSAARFTPTKRIFTHTCGLDHRLFDERQKLRPEVRGYVMASISQFFRSYGERYRGWAHWCRVYFAGSEASEWTSESLEGNNDFDVLLGIEYDRFRAATGSTQSDQQITDELNAALHADSTTWGADVWISIDGVPTGPWDRTTYINPQSWDIRRIKPYAAYEVGEGRWVVKPPHLPHWSLSDFPKTVVATLRAAETYAKSVLKLPEPERTQQGAALFTAWHEDRSRAFSERGQGWFDIANLREKWMDQEGLWAQLVDCAHRAKEGLDLAAVDWSNTPPGYTASLPKTQKCKYCDKQATKRVIHSEGMAYIPACPDHLDKAKADAAKSVPYGEPDPSNINAIRPIAVTMPYIRNNSGMRQHAPSGFGQEHEPWGRYMSPHQGHVPEGWEHGSVDFDNPLHVEHNGGEWKQQLSEQHGGATGKDLSRALLVKGHDAVITHDQHGIGEMVDLRPRGQRGHRVEAAYADYVRDAWNRKAEQPEWDEKTKAQFRQNGEEDYRYHSGTTKHHQGDDWPGVGWVKTDKIAQYRDRDPDKPEHWLGGKGGSSERIINSLREGFRNGEGWEHPIQLHYHPGSNTTWMGEGNHRLRAAELEGHTHVPVTVRLDRHRPNQGKPFEGEAKHDFQLPEEDNGRIHPKHLLPSDWLASEQHKTARGGPVEATQTKTVMITPMLFVGAEIPPGLQHWKRVSSPQEALSATEAGYTAILPPNAWMAVLTVLQAWGVSRRDAEDRIRFVRGQ
jgi:GNAT superfamily N-acetyltransferase